MSGGCCGDTNGSKSCDIPAKFPGNLVAGMCGIFLVETSFSPSASFFLASLSRLTYKKNDK